jgi:hypothetical protein
MHTKCYVDIDNKANLDVTYADRDGRVECKRFVFTDANQLIDIAEKMKLCGFDMLRHAPRPDPS